MIGIWIGIGLVASAAAAFVIVVLAVANELAEHTPRWPAPEESPESPCGPGVDR
jgi:hypothetical protein